MFAVIYTAGTRTAVQDLSAASGNSTQPTDALLHRYIIKIRTDKVYFYIDGESSAQLVATFTATTGTSGPSVQTLPISFLAVGGSTPPVSNTQIQSVGATVWDTGKNTSQISDGTYPWRKAKVNANGELSVAAGVTAGTNAPYDSNGERALNVKNNDQRIFQEKQYLENYRTNMMAISGNYGFELR